MSLRCRLAADTVPVFAPHGTISALTPVKSGFCGYFVVLTLSESQEHHGEHKGNPKSARQSDRTGPGHLDPISVKPSVEANDTRRKNEPPQPETNNQRET